MSLDGDGPGLSAAALEALAVAVERGLLAVPFGRMQVGRCVTRDEQDAALRLLERLHRAGLAGGPLAAALRLAAQVQKSGEARPRPVLVWSDLDVHGSRDTRVVCAELFSNAESSVLVSTYNLGHWTGEGEEPGNPVLRPLGERMQERPGLHVRLFVNLPRREWQKDMIDTAIERDFANHFCRWLWPWDVRPEVYYDPRSLAAPRSEQACLHAKCVTVDDRRAFVTSANLTEAAYERNIEAGVLLEDALFARTLRIQLESLISRGHVRRIAGI